MKKNNHKLHIEKMFALNTLSNVGIHIHFETHRRIYTSTHNQIVLPFNLCLTHTNTHKFTLLYALFEQRISSGGFRIICSQSCVNAFRYGQMAFTCAMFYVRSAVGMLDGCGQVSSASKVRFDFHTSQCIPVSSGMFKRLRTANFVSTIL